MKTKILGGIFALAVMVATGYGVNRSMEKEADLPEMALKNVEALADNEIGKRGVDLDRPHARRPGHHRQVHPHVLGQCFPVSLLLPDL